MPKGKVKNAWVNSPQADEVAEYYTQGHSVKETSEHFNVSKVQINNLVKARRITNGKNWRDAGDETNAILNEERRRQAEQSLKESLESKGFFYCGGYTNKRGSAKIRCKSCGTEYTRTVGFLQYGNISCQNCRHIEAMKREEHRKMVARNDAEIKALEREWCRLLNPPKDKRKEGLLDREGVCEICGKPYKVREYVESVGLKYATDCGVCSAECKKEKIRRNKRKFKTTGNHRHRAKQYGCVYEPGITLRKLVKRDGLRCAICGGMCDWNDRSWTEYSGPMYPSIDHIVPMSKGGGHTWDNVQVTHLICNSLKSDNIQGARKVVQDGKDEPANKSRGSLCRS